MHISGNIYIYITRSYQKKPYLPVGWLVRLTYLRRRLLLQPGTRNIFFLGEKKEKKCTRRCVMHPNKHVAKTYIYIKKIIYITPNLNLTGRVVNSTGLPYTCGSRVAAASGNRQQTTAVLPWQPGRKGPVEKTWLCVHCL